MRRLLAPLAVPALFALAACGGAGNEAAGANETLSGDSNAMGEAVSDVDAANAALDGAFTNAENAYAGNGAAMAEGNEITD